MASGLCNTLRDLYTSLYPLDEESTQRRLEDTLLTYCDDIQAGQIGMHWSFDWLFAPREAFALSVGRWFELNRSYCHITFKHQSNQGPDTKGTGVIFELKLPLHTFRYNAYHGELTIDYTGEVEYQVKRLETSGTPGSGEGLQGQGWATVSIDKRLWRPGRPWHNSGTMELFTEEGGDQLCAWSWSYDLSSVIDRPDYDLDVLLPILRADMIPSGNGHLIPAMRAEIAAGGTIRYTDGAEPEIEIEPEAAYLDGNFGLSSRLDSIVKDRWAWMCAPQLWAVDGTPVEHMMTFGFYQGPILPWRPPTSWSGAILWRRSQDDMTRFSPWTLLDDVEVRFHSPSYLDVSIITFDKAYRVTVRAWSVTMTTPLSTPSGRRFHDHQDLLADAYVVIEENVVDEGQRCWRTPQWVQVDRLVTNMFGFEFGEQDRVIGTPGYPAYDAVPAMPAWFVQALEKIPTDALGHPTKAPRLVGI